MTTDERAVLLANAAFYRAFAARDVEAMDALWARTVPVACIHPGWQVLNGREAVMASWRGILGGVPPAIECSEEIARVAGSAAFVVCTERLDAGELVATNVFVQAIRPPTVPDGTARLRATLMATHTDDDLEHAIRAFAALRDRI